MPIKNDLIDVAETGVKIYEAKKSVVSYIFVGVAVIFVVVALVFFFSERLFFGGLFVFVALVLFGVSRIFKFTSKIGRKAVEKLESYKD